MAITSVSTYQAAANGALRIPILKTGITALTGQWSSLWLATGSPAAGAIPTTAATCTTATTGAAVFTYPSSGTLYVTNLVFMGGGLPGGPASLMTMDRLSHMGGLSGTNTGSQTVGLNVPASRGARTDLANVEWYVECFAQMGSSSQTLTISYTNTSDVSGRTVTVTIPATMKLGTLIRVVPTIAGDIIKSIDSCTLSGSTGTAGNFGFFNSICLTLARAAVGFKTRKGGVFRVRLPVVLNNACIAFAITNASAGGVATCGSLSLGVG